MPASNAENDTRSPAASIDGRSADSGCGLPAAAGALTASVCPVTMLRTKIWGCWSAAPRFAPTDLNATTSPAASTAGSNEEPSADAPSVPSVRLTSDVSSVPRSRTYTWFFLSSGAPAMGAVEIHATRLPSALTAGLREASAGTAPAAPLSRSASTVVLAARLRTYRCDLPSAPAGSSGSLDSMSTVLPSALIGPANPPLGAGVPSTPSRRLTSVVVFESRSRTYTLATPLGAFASTLPPRDWNTTLRPSPLMPAPRESPSAAAPSEPDARLTNTVRPVARSRTNTLSTELSSASESASVEDVNTT